MDPHNTGSIAQEHGALREMARRIRALLEGSECPCHSTRCSRCLCEGVGALAERLKSHFASEEESWGCADGSGRDRTTQDWIDRLVREHGQFRKRVDALILELEKVRDHRISAAASLQAALHALLDDLIEHELSEARLFQRSLFEQWGLPQ